MNETYQDLEGYPERDIIHNIDRRIVWGTDLYNNYKLDMSTVNKYFTPSIEDIRVGYQYEYLADPSKDLWRGGIIEDLIEIMEGEWDCNMKNKINLVQLFKYKCIRVSYLTKEQIEKEGWTITDIFNDETTHTYPRMFRAEKKKDDKVTYGLRWRRPIGGLDRLTIGIKVTVPNHEKVSTLYSGECKDINAFRYICKLLGI